MQTLYVSKVHSNWCARLITPDSTSEPLWFNYLADAQRWAKQAGAKCLVTREVTL